jgi:serine/threonine protein kinase
MAEIYLARASGIQGFQKYVVLKRILPQFAENHELIRMFLQEARLAAILDHANIAQVHDIGEEGGTFFFTMEYLHGEDVRWMARRLRERDAVIPLEHAVHILIDAAAGVHFAHEKKGPDERPLGIVHRDLSPSNIVVTYAGGVKVVDFGVAKIATDPELSGRYSLKGKLAYMSPEQVTQGTVDRRSDVFSLGIVLYEMTTAKRLFKAANEIETMRLALEANVAKPSTIIPDYPPELERIVMRALERSPDRRYQTARELQMDLEAFARDQKLQISSAALAEWMEGSFGPKREIWHSLPDLAEAGSQSTPRPEENTGATRKVTHAEIDVAPSPRRGRSRRTMLITAVAALAVLFLGGGAFGLRHRVGLDQPSAPAASGSGAVLVVAENGNVAIERSEPPPATKSSTPPAPAAPVAAVAIEERAPRSTRAPRASSSARSHRPSGPEVLSSAVAKRAPDIRRCFEDLDTGGANESEISLRFDVGTDGAVKSLAVLPAAVGGTPLGACLVKVGRTTAFAPQPEPITFRIPLTVHLRHQERSR